VKGDLKCTTIAAASIIAKVHSRAQGEQLAPNNQETGTRAGARDVASTTCTWWDSVGVGFRVYMFDI